jgi:hypothetical protein
VGPSSYPPRGRLARNPYRNTLSLTALPRVGPILLGIGRRVPIFVSNPSRTTLTLPARRLAWHASRAGLAPHRSEGGHILLGLFANKPCRTGHIREQPREEHSPHSHCAAAAALALPCCLRTRVGRTIFASNACRTEQSLVSPRGIFANNACRPDHTPCRTARSLVSLRGGGGTCLAVLLELRLEHSLLEKSPRFN